MSVNIWAWFWCKDIYRERDTKCDHRYVWQIQAFVNLAGSSDFVKASKTVWAGSKHPRLGKAIGTLKQCLVAKTYKDLISACVCIYIILSVYTVCVYYWWSSNWYGFVVISLVCKCLSPCPSATVKSGNVLVLTAPAMVRSCDSWL